MYYLLPFPSFCLRWEVHTFWVVTGFRRALIKMLFDNFLTGLAAAGLLIYLLYALLFPERI